MSQKPTEWLTRLFVTTGRQLRQRPRDLGVAKTFAADLSRAASAAVFVPRPALATLHLGRFLAAPATSPSG
jgi:hypothetical protein